MEHVVDTLIVGGGPAGLSCGIRLQKNGVSNLILEKHSFPREKTCGGGVTEKTFRLLLEKLELPEEALSPVFCDENDVLELYYKNERLTRSPLSKRFRFVRRYRFDEFLAREYQTRGGLLLENVTGQFSGGDDHCVILSNGDAVRYRHLVVADGALSPTAKALGYKAPELGFFVETYVPKEKLPDRDAVGIYFGFLKSGYAWVFPSGEEFCIGLGGRYQASISYDGLLKDFLKGLGLEPEDYPIKGAFLPYGELVKQRAASEDVLLIGDAGGFVDPIYCEGLYFAIASGVEAADAILECPEKVRPAFLRRMAPCAKIIKQGRRLRRIFFLPFLQKRFPKIVSGHHRFVGFYIDHMLAEYDYPYSRLRTLCRDYKKGKRKTESAR